MTTREDRVNELAGKTQAELHQLLAANVLAAGAHALSAHRAGEATVDMSHFDQRKAELEDAMLRRVLDGHND